MKVPRRSLGEVFLEFCCKNIFVFLAVVLGDSKTSGQLFCFFYLARSAGKSSDDHSVLSTPCG